MAEWLMISKSAMNKIKAANRQNRTSHRGNNVSTLNIHRKIALDSAKRLILSPLSSNDYRRNSRFVATPCATIWFK